MRPSRKALTWWPLWLLALGSIGLYSIATPTGVRRAIPLVFVASLLLGEVLDWALQSRRLSSAAVVIVSLAVVLLLASQTLATARALNDQRLVLPRDFDWIGGDMKSLLENQSGDPRTRDAVLELKNPIARCACFTSCKIVHNAHPIPCSVSRKSGSTISRPIQRSSSE